MKLTKFLVNATAACLLLGTSGAAMAQLVYSGCLKDNGKIKNVAPGGQPTKPCKNNQTVFSFPDQEQVDILTGAVTGVDILVNCTEGDVLQDAVNAALPFTTILVEGTCTENI